MNNLGKAVLVLDLQNDFIGINAKFPVARHQVPSMISNVNHIIRKKNEEKWHIIYIGNEFKKSQLISNWFRDNAALKGSAGAMIHEDVNVVNDLYFSKTSGDAFHNKKLVEYVNEHKINEVIIVGVFAEGCVFATAKGAKKQGIKVTVIKDAIAAANDSLKDKAVEKLESLGISIQNSICL
ncbi:cysteine hydrolase family protein [Mesobacillus thioparans]|uniref:cysteine hydrolase family protein n=1 Tax=Mesobacillus thioparans TaxID=370439 RepID=UPI0039EF5E76